MGIHANKTPNMSEYSHSFVPNLTQLSNFMTALLQQKSIKEKRQGFTLVITINNYTYTPLSLLFLDL